MKILGVMACALVAGCATQSFESESPKLVGITKAAYMAHCGLKRINYYEGEVEFIDDDYRLRKLSKYGDGYKGRFVYGGEKTPTSITDDDFYKDGLRGTSEYRKQKRIESRRHVQHPPVHRIVFDLNTNTVRCSIDRTDGPSVVSNLLKTLQTDWATCEGSKGTIPDRKLQGNWKGSPQKEKFVGYLRQFTASKFGLMVFSTPNEQAFCRGQYYGPALGPLSRMELPRIHWVVGCDNGAAASGIFTQKGSVMKAVGTDDEGKEVDFIIQ